MNTKLTVFYDYLCPYANRVATWLEGIKEDIGGVLSIEWKTFSLEQQNSDRGPDFRIWEHPEVPSWGLPALVAAKAAKNQGEAAFLKFHLALFNARHHLDKNIGEPAVLTEIAREENLEMTAFEKDFAAKKSLDAVGKDHMEAREKYNIFGVPTLVFGGKKPVYIKLEAIPDGKKDRISLFESIFRMAVNRPYLIEVKRPDPILL